jgi:hypothetical protein
VILRSDFTVSKSRAGGAANLIIPCLVIAIHFVSALLACQSGIVYWVRTDRRQ